MAKSRAWIVTTEGIGYETEVISIISARKKPAFVEEYIKLVHALLYCRPDTHLEMARYNKPLIPYVVMYDETNTHTRVRTMMSYGTNPYLVARLAANVVLDTSGGVPFLEWDNPPMIVCDPRTLRVVGRKPRASTKAPMRVPFRDAFSERLNSP